MSWAAECRLVLLEETQDNTASSGLSKQENGVTTHPPLSVSASAPECHQFHTTASAFNHNGFTDDLTPFSTQASPLFLCLLVHCWLTWSRK